ncbi:MAG TPA: hypothetical protein VF199_08640 [Bacillales bacterium]
MSQEHDEILQQAAEFIKEHDLKKLKIKGADGEKFTVETEEIEESDESEESEEPEEEK